MPPVQIRPLTYGDRSAALKLGSHPLLLDSDALASFLLRNSDCCLMAWQAETPRGFLLGSHDGWQGRVIFLALDQSGDALPTETALINEFLKRLGRLGVKSFQTTLSLATLELESLSPQITRSNVHLVERFLEPKLVAPSSQGCVDCPMPKLHSQRNQAS
jgi:hypothetical protein